MQIDGRTALITGANGGLGEAMATRLKAAGARLILHGRRKDALEPVCERLGARMLLADLAKREDQDRLHEEAGDVDIVILNAALPASGLLLDMDVPHIDRALEVNLRAPIVSAQHFARQMSARGSGHIVFISSISGKVSNYGTSMYSATKFGMRGFATALREEMAEKGVGVSTVFPGFIRDAGMFAKAEVKLPGGVGTRTPEDVAKAVLRCIEKNVAEVDVAALDQRLGAVLAAISPGLVMGIARAFGGHELSKQINVRQRDVR